MRPSTFVRAMWVFSDRAGESWPTAEVLKRLKRISVGIQYFISSPSRSSFRLVNQDLGALLLTPALHTGEELSQFGHEKAGLSSRRRLVPRNAIIVIGVLLLRKLDETHSSKHVDAASGCVVKDVVGIAGNFGGRDLLATPGVKNEQARRHPGGD